MRFFKYLVFIILSFFSSFVYAVDTYYIQSYQNITTSSTFSEACSKLASHFTSTLSDNGLYSYSVGAGLKSTYCPIKRSDGALLHNDIIMSSNSCPSTVTSTPISVPNWDKWTLDQSDAYYAKNVNGKTACYQGCRYKDPSMGGTPPEMHLTYGSPVEDSSCPPDSTTKPSTPVPDGTPPQPTECKNASGSDSYCDKPPTGCPSGYTSGSFNNKEICVKNSTDPDPTKPNPNDPNNGGGGDGEGNCNGTNNCNTNNFDDSKIVSAIESLKSSINSAISSMTNALSSAISSVTSAVNASADKVKAAVDANTAATNSVKTSVDANTTAVNANGDKVKSAVDSNTAAVNANGDKIKGAVDANTTAVNANGDKVKGAVDENTAAVKEGNGLLSDIKNWLTSTDGVQGEAGLLTIDQIELEPQQDKFQWSAQCPAPIEKTTSIIGYSWTYSFSFDSWCSVLARLSNYFVFAATFGACLIIAGVRNG